MIERRTNARTTPVVLLLLVTMVALVSSLAGAQTKITVWGHGHAAANNYIAKLTQRYQEEFGVEVEYAIKSTDATMVSLIGGAGPDIFEVHVEPFVYAQMGFAHGMTDDIAQALGYQNADHFLERYFPHNRQYVSYEGAPIAVYRELNTFGLVASKKAFEDTGYDVSHLHETLNYWDDVIATAGRLTQTDAEGNLRRLGFYVAEPSWGGLWAGLLPLQSLVFQAGGTMTTPDGMQATLDTPAGHAALEVWQRLGQAQGGFNTRIGGWSGLITGGYGMMQGSLFSPQSAVDGTSGQASLDDVMLIAQPLLENATERYPFDQPHYFMVNNDSPNLEEAWRFLDWMTSGDRLIGWFEEVGYFMPQYELQEYAVAELAVGAANPAVNHLREVINWQGNTLPPFPGTTIDSKGPITGFLAQAVQAAFHNRAPIPEIAAEANLLMNNYLAGGQ